MNKNFLNNQNYILGKAEKKKIFIHYSYNYNNLFTNYFILKYKKGYSILFSLTIVLITLFWFDTFLCIKVIFLVPIVYFILVFINLFDKNENKTNNVKYSEKKFLLSKGGGGLLYSLVYLISFYIFYIFNIEKFINFSESLGYGIVFIIFFHMVGALPALFIYSYFGDFINRVIKNNILFRIDFIFVLFLPYYLLFYLFFNIYGLFKINKAKIIKYNFRILYNDSFDKISENYAENEYYRLEIKK